MPQTVGVDRQHQQEEATDDSSPAAPDDAHELGAGPFERLVALLDSGELSPVEAAERAADTEAVTALTPDYVAALCRWAELAAQQGSGELALQLLDLVLVATEAAGRDAAPLAASCKLSFIEVAHAYLMGVPDGRVYARATALGDELVNDPEVRGVALHRLGTMNLDPYSAGRSTEAYWEAHERWLQNTPIGPGGFPIPEAEMPAPKEALRRADSYLARATELRTGQARGASRKARVQALVMLGELGDPVDVAALADECHTALSELTWQDYPSDRLVLLNTLRFLGRPIELDEVERVFARSLDEWRQRVGPYTTGDLVLQAYFLLREERPRRTLDLLLAAQPLAAELKEETRIALLRAEVTVLSKYLVGPQEFAGEEGIEGAVTDARNRAADEAWDVERLFCTLLAIVVAASDQDQEESALLLLKQACELAPLLAHRHARALDWLRANYLLGMGVNGYNRSDWAASVSGYTQALAAYLALELAATAENCLARIHDVVSSGIGGNAVLAFARGLAPIAVEAEQALGSRAASVVQGCVERILGSAPDDLDPDTLLFLYQLAKGLRFATALYGGSRYRWSEDMKGAVLLDAIDAAEQEAVHLGPDAWEPLDENVLLADYEVQEVSDGEETAHVARLRATFDEHLWEELLAGAAGDEVLWLAAADVQAALDERTALISYLLGLRTTDDRSAVGVLVLTRNHMGGYVIPQEEGFVGLSIDGQVMPRWLGLGTRVTREGVQASPGPDVVSSDGSAALLSDYGTYLGDGEVLRGLLEEGIDHLCVVPHRSLHFHPLHLVGPPERPVADDWIITYLPNLHLFVSRRGRPAARRHREAAITSIGLSFGPGNVHGLPPIERAVPEAEAVAATFGAKALPEAQATEAAVRGALEHSRFVHLSTHGRHNAEAPAFQCLFFTPEGESDGRLYAHELLSLDLRGLDLVTLSACETALGRFDASDNLRGLPAALLLSGVSTLVGTLWEVEAGAAERFFTQLYGELHSGVGCLDAFRTAQQRTRTDYPAYRDWGAFYMAGDWLW